MRRHPRYSSAFNGISVLDLPADRIALNRGVYATYSLNLEPIKVNAPREHSVPNNTQDTQKETQVVVEALQKLLRQQKPPQSQFGLAHPIR